MGLAADVLSSSSCVSLSRFEDQTVRGERRKRKAEGSYIRKGRFPFTAVPYRSLHHEWGDAGWPKLDTNKHLHAAHASSPAQGGQHSPFEPRWLVELQRCRAALAKQNGGRRRGKR